MKEHPILFSGAMVRALLDGSKTQTRRIFKQAYGPSLSVDDQGDGIAELSWLNGDGPGYSVRETTKLVSCPYGVPGDRLYVRETWMPDAPCDGTWAGVQFYGCKGSPLSDIPERFQTPDDCVYRADRCGPELVGWRPSIHMPRWASRITLEVTGARVERLQDISEADAIAEGIERSRASFMPLGFRLYDQPDKSFCTDPIESYRSLWDSLNASRGYGWDVNPWVWVVEFRRVGQ